MTVLATMIELADAGFGVWRECMDGLLEFHGIGGGRWHFIADAVMRMV
jgi:hypothetical protein